LHSTTGVRVVAWDEYFVGVKKTARRDDELVVAVRIPIRRGPQAFLKVGTRNAMVIAVSSVCLTIDLDEQRVRCALGAVGPVPLRARAAESWAAGALEWDSGQAHLRDASTAIEFGRRVGDEARPIDDHRGTAAFRRHAIAVCARRALTRTCGGGR
jgi:CO/xanthine dehydrogenase FAD-binding subunit